MTPETDRSEANKKVARDYVRSFSDPTGAESARLLHDDAVIQIMSRGGGGGDLPAAMTKDAYLRFRVDRRPEFLPLGVRHEVRTLIAEGDTVAAETECFADLPCGGRYNNLFCFVFEISDGRVRSSREYTDFLYAQQTLFASGGE